MFRWRLQGSILLAAHLLFRSARSRHLSRTLRHPMLLARLLLLALLPVIPCNLLTRLLFPLHLARRILIDVGGGVFVLVRTRIFNCARNRIVISFLSFRRGVGMRNIAPKPRQQCRKGGKASAPPT